MSLFLLALFPSLGMEGKGKWRASVKLYCCLNSGNEKKMIFEQKESINRKCLEDAVFLCYLWMHDFSICHKRQKHEHFCGLMPFCLLPIRDHIQKANRWDWNEPEIPPASAEAPKFILILKSYLKPYSLILKTKRNILREMCSLIKCGARLGEELAQAG